MKLALVAAFCLAANLPAQQDAKTTPFTDPANLRGERVSPRTGRELPIDQGARGLQQMLRKLNTRASLMLIVAHPDDEDGGLLTLYSRGLGARVATLTLTRGEGGQNAVTGDFEDALGLIRTQELLSADRYMGVDQMFGTEVDFGFSKTKAEAFAKWTHERVLYDAVRAVRLYRPLVIAAVFVGGVTDGHGQHQVSGEIAQEVFNAAGDPKVFPELTAEGILPWQPLKVYARVPRQAITPQGLFDYATGQYAPARFTNYVTGEVSTTVPSVDVVVHEGTTDPLLTNAAANRADLPSPAADPNAPLSYVQFARIGLGLQKSQIGPGVRVPPAGRFDIGYHLYGSHLCEPATNPTTVIRSAAPNSSTSEEAVILSAARSAESKDPCILPASPTTSTESPAPPSASFFDGIDTSINGIGLLTSAPPAFLADGLQQFSAQIAAATAAFDPTQPSALALRLVEAQHQLGALLDQLEHATFPGRADVLHELRIKQVQLNDALICALGLELKATAPLTDPDIIRGTAVTVETKLQTTAAEPIGIFSENLETSADAKTERLLAVDAEPAVDAHTPFLQTFETQPSLTARITRPYFFRSHPEQPVYELLDPALRDAPATPPALTIWVTLRYHQTEIRLGHVLSTDDPNDIQPLSIVPPLSLALAPHAQALANTRRSFPVTLRVAPPSADRRQAHLEIPPGWKITPEPSRSDDDTGETRFRLDVPGPLDRPVRLSAAADLPNGEIDREGYRSVGYAALPRTNYFTPATTRIVPVDLKLPSHLRIAYLPGTGDAVPEALASINLPVTTLTVADLTPARLAAFDTVILGVRTYIAHPELHGAPTQALLDFARNGGNVVVQYQISDFTAADAPYPLALGSTEKVVDESAPVHLLDTQSPLFTVPNRISAADFNGWIEERGHGFLSTWDPRYTALTETHDPGGPETPPQAPQRGGLITVQLGRGRWTYCAFALYRQLPEAVPGAFRLFTNLLAAGDTPQP